MKYDLLCPWKTLDNWQKEVLKTEGNICLRSGRQVGKSTVISILAGEYALNNPNKLIMVIASVERSAFLLFEKILSYIHTKDKTQIMTGRWRPTKSQLRLKNKSRILCLPTGETGYGIRGHTINLLVADEAQFINEEVWTAVTPMLAITKGKIILLSTPHGREGYFYRCFQDDNFTSFHISSEDCPRKDVDFLKREKERMTKAQYAQEYLGEFCDELTQFFPSELINECQKGIRRETMRKEGNYFCGVDVARLGEDETRIVIIDKVDKDNLIMVENILKMGMRTTDTAREIVLLNKKYNFKKIYIDDGGVGAGVLDILLECEETRRKVEAINNASKSLDMKEEKKKKLLKEDLYNNLLRLMEQKKIILLDDIDIYRSFKSVQFEYLEGGQMKIFGNYTHIVEATIRSAWCVKDKTLNIWVC